MPLPRLSSIKNMLPEIKLGDDRQIDFWNAWRVANEYKESTKLLDKYIVEESVTWHTLAEAVYDDRELWWVVPLFNDIEDPFLMFSDSNMRLKERKLNVLNPEHLNQFLNEIRSFRVKKEREL
jgi:hypothetical protein